MPRLLNVPTVLKLFWAIPNILKTGKPNSCKTPKLNAENKEMPKIFNNFRTSLLLKAFRIKKNIIAKPARLTRLCWNPAV